jgi:alpha-L-rhamnosidase
MIAKGATTIWERWNGDVGDVAMNSFNHYALGAVAGFLFRRIAGIDAAAPGFTRIDIRPVLDPRLRRAGGDYDSVLGRISTDWDWDPGRTFKLAVAIPPNATARVRLPAHLGRQVEVVSGGQEALPATLTDVADAELGLELGAGLHAVTVTP